MAKRPNGDLEEVFEDVFFVTGEVKLAPGVKMSRNMTVLRSGGALTVLNSMRLDERSREQLEALGEVKDVIRVAGFHGKDDKHYHERYRARVWALPGVLYARGFDPPKRAEDIYFEATEALTPQTLPIADKFRARLCVVPSKPPEAYVHLDINGGVLVVGDALQNIGKPDAFYTLGAKIIMRPMGFFKPHAIGPGWLKAAKPDAQDVLKFLDLDFEHVLPVHGDKVLGGAKEKYRPAIERAAQR